jgi:hypothetical protein
MDPLGDPLTTPAIKTGWEFTMESYLSGQLGDIDEQDRQFVDCSVWTRTLTHSASPEQLLTLVINSSLSGTISYLALCEKFYLMRGTSARRLMGSALPKV